MMYRKLEILSKWCLFSKLAVRMGTYDCGMFIFMDANKCMYASIQLFGKILAAIF